MSTRTVGVPAPREGIVQTASELRAGDHVVYPGQGVHRVAGLERMDIAGQRLDVLKLEREHDGGTVRVPVEKVPTTGLRRVAGRKLVDEVFRLLGAPGGEVELDWKERHREIGERLIGGGLLGVAEVVKELNELSKIRPPPPKEREQYDKARHLLVEELAVSLAAPPALAEDYIDYALSPPAGVELRLKPSPTPKPARSVPRRPEPRHAPEGLEEVRGEEAPALVEEEKPRGRKRAARGERARGTRGKERPPKKRGAKKARQARRGVDRKRPARKGSRARR